VSIVCVGQLVADVVVRPVEGLPVSGRAEPVEELQLLSGGCAANTAAVLAKLGASVRLVAVIGCDAFGDAVLADLQSAGVGLETVVREIEAPTSAAIVLVTGTGQRSFFYRPGGNERLSNRHVADAVLKTAKIIHVGGALKLLHLDLVELMQRAKSFGCITSLDTDWDFNGHWMKTLREALPQIDYLITNEEEAVMLTGKQSPHDAACDLLSRGPKAVVVKRGERGCLSLASSGAIELPACRVDVRDTTCAGDAFVAGFLLGIGDDKPLDESLRLANAAGALCTTQISHRAISSLDDVRDLMKRTPR
jgi:sugar/nucleoside kinase (ribokinase family)